jgi:hypothetical protein
MMPIPFSLVSLHFLSFQSRQKSTPRPVEEVRIGSVKAAIWTNETENGTRYNVAFQRIYRDDQKRWCSADSSGRDELLVLAKVADEAHDRPRMSTVLLLDNRVDPFRFVSIYVGLV